MARKRRVHYPGAVYHVMLHGNGGQGIFFDDEDRFYFGELLLEGVARFEHRIHGFCFMGNHVHLVVQVGVIPLSRIIQNASFRYTRWINKKQKRMGHLFQGRYKAILVDADQYLLELIRYVHLNPVRNGLVNDPEQYFWSSHAVYTGKRKMPWVHTEWVHAQFSRHLGHARRMYRRYVEEALEDTLRPEFEKGNKEGRILGGDHFAESALQQAGEHIHQTLELEEIIQAVCQLYRITEKQLIAKGKERKPSEARSVIAWIVRESENLTLEVWGERCCRDGVTLSNAIRILLKRVKTDKDLVKRMKEIEEKLLISFGSDSPQPLSVPLLH